MKLIEKLKDKLNEPTGINLKDYRKCSESNSRKVDKIIADLEKLTTKVLNLELVEDEKLYHFDYLRDVESLQYGNFFGYEEFGSVVAELNFNFRVLGNAVVANDLSSKLLLRMVEVLSEVREMVLYYTLVCVNDKKNGGNINWDGENFVGTGGTPVVETLRYMTDYVMYLEMLIDNIYEVDKIEIEATLEQFEAENINDYSVSIFPEFPSRYDVAVQKTREESDGEENELDKETY